jgi:putative oxidoreductase
MASFNHFKNLNCVSEYAKAKGMPSPKVAVGGTGVILLVRGLSMLLGVYPVVGIILLIIFTAGHYPSGCIISGRWPTRKRSKST